jgi:hypothetical protein
MFRSQCLNLRLIGSQLCRVRFARQDRGSQYFTALGTDEPYEIGQRPALTDEIVYDEVPLPWDDRSAEQGLICKTPEPIRAGVPHGVQLND